jgi:hypothetical protein
MRAEAEKWENISKIHGGENRAEKRNCKQNCDEKWTKDVENYLRLFRGKHKKLRRGEKNVAANRYSQ